MSVEIKLGTDVVWGTSSAGSVSQGKILSCSSKGTAKIFEQEDENDELYSAIFHDQREEVTLEILAGASATKPDPGDLITAAGVTDLLVKDAETKWATGTTKKFSVNAFKSLA